MSTDPSQNSTRKVFSISELNRKAKELLEIHLPLIWVEGEISNLSQPSSGHWYFTLKDENAQVRCAMFRGRNQYLKFKPAAGDFVSARVRVSLYEGRGEFQLIVEHMEEAGFGLLQKRFEELKSKLLQEGLFEEIHKQELPEYCRKLAVITSPTGAAIRDVLHVLARRFPLMEVQIIPSLVQGDEAIDQIVDAISLANRAPDIDAILLCRGGGSIEDLWAFNSERVARAIFASQRPLVSAVGHEVDFTIADFVADLRAPTPSAAAEILSPDIEDLTEMLTGYAILCGNAIQRKLASLAEKLRYFSAHVRHPGERLQQKAQLLDHLELRLKKSPRIFLGSPSDKLHKLGALLDMVSPLATLKRGYAIALNKHGKAIQDPKQVSVGDKLRIKVNKGTLNTCVQSLESQ